MSPASLWPWRISSIANGWMGLKMCSYSEWKHVVPEDMPRSLSLLHKKVWTSASHDSRHLTITPIRGSSPNCCHNKNVTGCYRFEFPWFEVRGPKLLEHENVYVHKAQLPQDNVEHEDLNNMNAEHHPWSPSGWSGTPTFSWIKVSLNTGFGLCIHFVSPVWWWCTVKIFKYHFTPYLRALGSRV